MTWFKHKEEQTSIDQSMTDEIDQSMTDEMVKYNIVRVPVNYFYYNGFRYTELKDAISQAKRDHLVS